MMYRILNSLNSYTSHTPTPPYIIPATAYARALRGHPSGSNNITAVSSHTNTHSSPVPYASGTNSLCQL